MAGAGRGVTGSAMFSKVLVANRGEIAVRVIRTCHDLGVRTVAVHSDADAGARHVRTAGEAVRLPGVASSETYLNLEAVIEAARATGAEAVHPGYGFLSERAEAAEAIAAAGLTWIGPPPNALRAAGDKVRARRLAESRGVPVVPGTLDPVRDAAEVRAFGEEHGYPVAIKAAGGGGGRGLKVAAAPEEVDEAFASAVREAEAYFGQGDVYLERYLRAPKHLEVQVLSPAPGRAVALGVRECSLQRRHQKLVEETPPPRHAALLAPMSEAAARIANACGYVSAGTVEFLVDTRAPGGSFHFLEINARLQVEHTVTEAVLGADLVAAQLRIAAGDPDPLASGDLPAPRGHAIECRVNAEDPARGFLPSPGRIARYREPGGPGIRVDSGYEEGDEVPAAYDSLVGKVIAWGETREESRRRMLRALGEFEIEGVATSIPAHVALLSDPSFVDGTYTTRTVDEAALVALLPGSEPGGQESAVLTVAGAGARLWHPALARFMRAATGRADRGAVTAPMHGTVLKVLVAPGDRVDAGDPVAVLEAMKMETLLAAGRGGTVRDVRVAPGAVVGSGEVVATIA